MSDMLKSSFVQNGSSVLILAENYPEKYSDVNLIDLEILQKRNMSVFVEYSGVVPGLSVSQSGKTVSVYDRTFVFPKSRQFLKEKEIMKVQGKFVASVVGGCIAAQCDRNGILVSGKVAGYDLMPYGFPKLDELMPMLFSYPQGSSPRFLFSMTRLTDFYLGRYAPLELFRRVFQEIFLFLDSSVASDLETFPKLSSTVGTMYGVKDPLPKNADVIAIEKALAYLSQSALLVRSPDPKVSTVCLLDPRKNSGKGRRTRTNLTRACVVSGYETAIDWEGRQPLCPAVRSDCVIETAMSFALGAKMMRSRNDGQSEILTAYAKQLMDYIYVQSVAQDKDFSHESGVLGLVAWGLSSLSWFDAFYGDDNARVLLASTVVSSTVSSEWDENILMAILANLRTSSYLTGFRDHRLGRSDLEKLGWQIHFDSLVPVVSASPHYDSYLWAVFLWAYNHTQGAIFRDMAERAIRRTMELYAEEKWRWTETWTEEQSRMLLPLSFLVRIDDTREHRDWLKKVAGDLLQNQRDCGAIQERLGPAGQCAACPPKSNADYGTHEAPIIQETGDPASDFLYTSNFAILGLLEAYHATQDAFYLDALNRLQDFSIRIQANATSPEMGFIGGGWLRAIDFDKFEFWGSSGDIGWGAFSQTTGWTETWVSSVMMLHHFGTSLWDITSSSKIDKELFDRLCPKFLTGLYSELCK